MTTYDNTDATIEDIVVDSTGEYSNSRSLTIKMKHVRLFTISKTELAKIILIKICFNF